MSRRSRSRSASPARGGRLQALGGLVERSRGYRRGGGRPQNGGVEKVSARLRAWTLFFMVGLVLSGLTALAIPTEVEAGAALLGEDFRADGWIPEWAARWLRTIHDGVTTTAERAPLMFYGTDWLAFGHFAIALAFVGALRDPVRNRWLCHRWVSRLESEGAGVGPTP